MDITLYYGLHGTSGEAHVSIEEQKACQHSTFEANRKLDAELREFGVYKRVVWQNNGLEELKIPNKKFKFIIYWISSTHKQAVVK